MNKTNYLFKTKKKRILIKIIRNKFILLLLLAHFLGIFLYFGGNNLINKNILYNNGYPYHLYHCLEAKEYFKEGKIWGYNPFFKAGHPSGIPLDNEFLQLLCTPFSFQNQIIILKVWVLLILISLPLLIYYSALNFKLSKRNAIAAMIIFLLYFYYGYFIKSAVFYGMINFIIGSMLSLFYVSLFYSYLKERSKKIFIFLCCSFPFFLLIHSSIWLTFFLNFFLMVWIYRVKIFKRIEIFIPLILGIILVSYWFIIPFFSYIFPYLKETHQEIFQISSKNMLALDFLNTYKNPNYHRGIQGFQYVKVSIILLGFLGLIKGIIKKEKLSLVLFISSLILGIITYFHRIIPQLNFISNIQPYKFIVPFIFFLIIPASNFFMYLINKIHLKKIRKRSFTVLILFLISQIIILSIFLPPKVKFFTQPSQDYYELMNWLEENTTNDKGRIMIEMNVYSHIFFNNPSYLFGIMNLDTHKEFLGGPHRVSSITHNFPSITKDIVFGRSWDNITTEKFQKFLEIYNIKYIIVRTKELKKKLYSMYQQNKSLFRKVHMIKSEKYNNQSYYKYWVYETNIKPNLIIGGNGEVSADFNKIQIKNLSKTNRSIILKYHWYPTLKTVQRLKIRPIFLLNSPVPFIEIVNISSNEVTIFNDY